jgi:hypothetical protein
MTTENRAALRLMIAERGLDGLLEDLTDVCEEITEKNRNNAFSLVWRNRTNELRKLSREWRN